MPACAKRGSRLRPSYFADVSLVEAAAGFFGAASSSSLEATSWKCSSSSSSGSVSMARNPGVRRNSSPSRCRHPQVNEGWCNDKIWQIRLTNALTRSCSASALSAWKMRLRYMACLLDASRRGSSSESYSTR